jgi:hypothetical protein
MVGSEKSRGGVGNHRSTLPRFITCVVPSLF